MAIAKGNSLKSEEHGRKLGESVTQLCPRQQLDKAEIKHTSTITNNHGTHVDQGQAIPEIVGDQDNKDNGDDVGSCQNKPGNSIPEEALQRAGVESISEVQHALGGSWKQNSLNTCPHSKSTNRKPVDKSQSKISRREKRIRHIMKTAKEQERAGIKDPILPDDEDPEDALLRKEMLKYAMRKERQWVS